MTEFIISEEQLARIFEWHGSELVTQDGRVLDCGDRSERVFLSPIVRCRDCEYLNTAHNGMVANCMKLGHSIFINDGFCAWGERRGE